jgi:hypothetical protein
MWSPRARGPGGHLDDTEASETGNCESAGLVVSRPIKIWQCSILIDGDSTPFETMRRIGFRAEPASALTALTRGLVQLATPREPNHLNNFDS